MHGRHAVPIDVHLMVKPVDRIVPDFAKAGANFISFHPEASDARDRTLQLIQRPRAARPGWCSIPATPLDVLDHVLGQARPRPAHVGEPGLRRAAFIPSALPKIARCAQAHRRAAGATSGSRSTAASRPTTSREVADAGADTFVAGTAIFGQPDYRRRRARCGRGR